MEEGQKSDHCQELSYQLLFIECLIDVRQIAKLFALHYLIISLRTPYQVDEKERFLKSIKPNFPYHQVKTYITV